MARYKQRCGLCKKNWALMSTGYQRFPVCIDCQMKQVDKPIKNASMKKLLGIPREWYLENHFLRSVRYQYGRFGDITQKQAEAFKNAVEEMKKNGGKVVLPEKKQQEKKKKEA